MNQPNNANKPAFCPLLAIVVKRASWPLRAAMVLLAAISIMVAPCIFCGSNWCGSPPQSVAWLQLVLAVDSIGFVLAFSALPEGQSYSTTRQGGVEALQLIRDWSTWMAGIQTAAFGAFAWLVFDKTGVKQLTTFQSFAAIFGFVHLGSALFCTAWLLSALPSHAIRLYATNKTSPSEDGDKNEQFDVYEQPLFGWWPKPKLAYMMTVMHWLWGIGLISLAAYCVSLLVVVENVCVAK